VSVGRNILKLIFSRVGAQVITLLTAPILTRLFDVSDFGVRQVFSSLLAVLVVLCCLRYELSIPLGKDRREAVSSFILSILLTAVFSVLLFVLVPILKGKIAAWYEMPELEVFLWLIPAFVLIQGIDLALRNWAGYEKKFGAIAWASFGAALGQRPVSLVWTLLLGATLTGLFVGAFGHIVVPLFVLLYFCGRSIKETIRSNKIDFKDLWTTAKVHKKFPVYNSWAAFLNSFSKQLPVFILGLYFTEEVIGYSVLGLYFLARSILTLPIRLITMSVSQVYYPMAAAAYAKTGSMSQITSDVFKRLVQIGVLPMLVLAFLGGPLFRFVFGEKWYEAGIYAQIMAPWLLVNFVSSPLTIYNILNRQGTGLIITVIAMIGRAASLLVGGMFFTPRIALALFSGFNVLIMMCSLFYRLWLAKVSVLWALEKLVKYCLVCSALIIPVMVLARWVPDWAVVIGAFLVWIIYIAVIMTADASLRRFVLSILEKFAIIRNSERQED